MLFQWTLPIFLLASFTIAQTRTKQQEASSTTATKSLRTSTTSNPTTTQWPVVSVFLPLNVPKSLAASIIRANAQETVFAVNCIDTPKCSNTDTFLLTCGASTFIATNTFSDSEGTLNTAQTISCHLRGGSPATTATCTRRSVIRGLGSEDSVSTLSESQIQYTPLTITAGAQSLKDLPSVASSVASSTSAGEACEVTGAVMGWAVRGAAAAAAVVIGGGL